MSTKAEVWRQRLAACCASGLSMAAYCREQGWPYAQCMYWQRRLDQRTLGRVPIRVEAPASGAALPTADGVAVEVQLPGAPLRIRGVSVADVTTLVRGLAC